MAVQVWIGEKPEHPNERRAIVALANGLERLEGLYLLLANFSVGGRTIDLVILKQDAIFILELKHCDGRVFGDVNGPWYVESANGTRKRLNPGRKNPYNQVISYYYSLINFLNEHRGEFLSPSKAASTDFRTCRRVVVIAPSIQEGSKIDVDWKVEVKGLDQLPSYLVTERSSEIDLSEEELLAIPELLHCTRWTEINALFAGVMRWEAESDAAPPAQPDAAAPAPAAVVAPPPATPAPPPSLWDRARRTMHTWTGRAALTFATLATVLLVALFLRPVVPVPRGDQPGVSLVGTDEPGPAAGGVLPANLAVEQSCTWSGFQFTGRKRGLQPGSWENVGVFGTAPNLAPDVVVTLEEVSFCNGRIEMTWSLQNNMADETAALPLTARNITVRDEHSNEYLITDDLSQPAEISVGPRQHARGVAVINRPPSLNASTLRITLREQPFGSADWMVPVTVIRSP